MRKPPIHTASCQRQQGAVLITSLLILFVMTLIGVTAMQTNSLEERMVGNMNERNLAFQAAESALRDADAFIRNPDVNSPPDATSSNANANDKVWTFGAAGDFTDLAWSDWTSDGIEYSSEPTTNGDPNDFPIGTGEFHDRPYWFVEQQAFVPDSVGTAAITSGEGDFYYRITASGLGRSPNTQAILQSVVKWRYQ